MDGLPSSGSGLLALRAVIPNEALSNHRSHLPSGCFRGACLSSLLPPRLFTGGPGVEVAFQGLERVRPHRLIFRDPLVELREALGLDRVDPLLRADGDIDELGVTEYPQVLRDPRLGEARKPRDDGPGGAASARKEVQDRPTCPVRYHADDDLRHDRP